MNKYIIVLIIIILILSISVGMIVSHEYFSDNNKIITTFENVDNMNTPGQNRTNTGNSSSRSLTYNSSNIDTVYHEEYPGYENKDLAGNLVYYKPGSFTYGASSYVPYYEDSVFLSRSNKSIINVPTYVSTSTNGGFCSYYKSQPEILEQKCKQITNENCAATECCVLLGGQKCVSGNESGPTMKVNYSDFTVLNKDYYYYKGKCYGNCPSPNPPLPTLP